MEWVTDLIVFYFIVGARKQDLPEIWEKLVDAGFER